MVSPFGLLSGGVDALLARVAALVPVFAAGAGVLDGRPAYPEDNIAALRGAGALAAPSPVRMGGLGLGTEPDGADALLDLLRLIGRGSLATGRLFEGHVNALKLISAYGDEQQIARAAEAASAGHLFGLWVTEQAPGLRFADGRLEGGKVFCSGAGHAAHVLVTATLSDGNTVLAAVTLDGAERARKSPMRLQGMRAAMTGAMDLTGLAADIVGAPGDYLRQPEFSAGAWRTSAVTLGGLEALCIVVRQELATRGRAGNPHQLVRIGESLIAQETAVLWLRKAARIAEGREADPGDVAAYVNLARIAVERATLDTLQLAQRALGLGCFVQGHAAERLIRDLSTYLRQPAPDETLTEAAAWFTKRDLPA